MRRMDKQTKADFLNMIIMLQNRTPKTVGSNRNREDIEWICSIAFSCGVAEHFVLELIPILGWDKRLSKDWPADKNITDYNFAPLVHECYEKYRRALLESFHTQVDPLELIKEADIV